MIKVEKLTKSYGRQDILKDFSIEFTKGEKVVVTGPSGCGKTTLLRLLAGLELPEKGEVLIDGAVASDAKSRRIPPQHRGIAWIPQDLGLWPNLSVYRNIALACAKGGGAESVKERVERALEQCQIADLKKRRPARLSAGEQQRVALARALVSQPRILLLDEPFASLDLARRKEFFSLLQETWTDDLLVVVVTHDPFDAVGLGAKRVVVLENGGLVEDLALPCSAEVQFRSRTLKLWRETMSANRF